MSKWRNIVFILPERDAERRSILRWLMGYIALKTDGLTCEDMEDCLIKKGILELRDNNH